MVIWHEGNVNIQDASEGGKYFSQATAKNKFTGVGLQDFFERISCKGPVKLIKQEKIAHSFYSLCQISSTLSF